MEQIVTRVSRLQVEKLMENGVQMPPFANYHFSNKYHIQVYRETTGNYSWGEKNDGNIQVGTGRGDKERFTVKAIVTKSGRKVRPVIIYKGPPLVNNSRINKIAVEIRDCKTDIHGNIYPS